MIQRHGPPRRSHGRAPRGAWLRSMTRTWRQTAVVAATTGLVLVGPSACTSNSQHGSEPTSAPPSSTSTGAVAPGPDAASQVDLTGLLPRDRQTMWDPGLNPVGGVPARTTVCATLSPSRGDDTAAIQA